MMPPSARALRSTGLSLLLVAWATVPLGCSKKDGEDALRAATITSTKPALPPPPAKCEAGADGKCSPSPSCSPSCDQVASPECVKCEASGDCADFANNCESPLLTPEERGVCYEIISCFHRTSCFDGPSTTLGSCYCGNLPLKECLAAPWTGPGAPDGACRDVMLKGMPSATKHSHVLGNMTTRVEHAAGAMALSRMNCQKIGFRKQCASVCGFGDIKPDPLPARRPAEALNR